MEKKIHYCWFGGKKLPKNVKKCINTWRKFLPDYEIIEWNENNFDINMSPFVKEAYESKKWAFVSDYARIYALYKEGGIYFDTDVKIIKDVKKIVDKDVFFGYEDSGFFGTAVIGVKEKDNKYIKEILDFYNNLDGFNEEMMYNYANPVIITNIINKYENNTEKNGITIFDNNIYVYPREYFYPYSYDYSEKVETENTCMVHLFNATWTSLGERRTINIYRKLGPDLGRTVNNLIDSILNVKNDITKTIKMAYRSLRMWYSIHINRKKRVAGVRTELQGFNNNYIVVCNPDISQNNQYLSDIYGNNILYLREQHTQKEAKLMANEISKTDIKEVIFNELSAGWDKLLFQLKKNNNDINIKIIIHGGIETAFYGWNWYIMDQIIELYAKKKIDELIFFNKSLYELYKNKGYKSTYLIRKIEIKDTKKYKQHNNNKCVKIGLYTNGFDVTQNIFNQIYAVSLIENSKLDVNPINHEIKITARRFNINLIGDSQFLDQEKLYLRLANNNINISIKLIDDGSLIPLQSFELGIPCVIGKSCKYFEGSDLEKHIQVENPNDIYEIRDKIKEVYNNREKILKEYEIWKHSKQ